MQRDLPAFRITTTSGHSWITSMARGITLSQAQAHFTGNRFQVSPLSGPERLEVAVKVEQLPDEPERCIDCDGTNIDEGACIDCLRAAGYEN